MSKRSKECENAVRGDFALGLHALQVAHFFSFHDQSRLSRPTTSPAVQRRARTADDCGCCAALVQRRVGMEKKIRHTRVTHGPPCEKKKKGCLPHCPAGCRGCPRTQDAPDALHVPLQRGLLPLVRV